MQRLYVRGSKGDELGQIKAALLQQLGPDEAKAYPGLSKGLAIDADTEAAIRCWQSGVGLIADGVIGPRNMEVLLGRVGKPLALRLLPSAVLPLFPGTKPANLYRYLPYVAASLSAWSVTDKDLILSALGLILVESEGFVPIVSTMAAQAQGTPATEEAWRYRGRGFVQLEGLAAYEQASKDTGLDLVSNPDLANAPEVACAVLAAQIARQAKPIIKALGGAGAGAARQLINQQAHGSERFVRFMALANKPKAQARLQPKTKVRVAAAGKANARKLPPPLKAIKDAIDVRDRPYVPPPVSLQEAYPLDKDVKVLLPRYTKAGLVLDQGQEGACTGFGLASVINYLRWVKANTPAKLESVSPRMLYNFARRYDEYAGEDYEGSSCRGAIKGWFNHGVCNWADWPYEPEGQVTPVYGYATRAAHNTLGVYYRVDKRTITDMQAAIQSVGAVYVSAVTHDGWNEVKWRKGVPRGHVDVPDIPYDGHRTLGGGHAFALVGFNTRGFVIQNSWSTQWGAGGFAVLSYEDWMANAMDAWVVALGVPGVVAGRATQARTAAGAKANRGADQSRWWSEAQAYTHSVVLGNDGRVERYLTEDERTRTLAHQVAVLPDKWFRRPGSAGKKRLVIYAHGGLNSEDAAIERARAMGRCFLGNDCYPLFLVWKTGLGESIGNILTQWWHGRPASGGLGDWVTDKTDRLIESTIGRQAARPIWSEMKENARLAFEANRGGDLLVRALLQLQQTWGDQLEIHLVGHSAGSIILGHLLSAVAQKAQSRAARVEDWITGVHLYAPACTVDFANRHYARHPAIMARTRIALLSDKMELEDNTAGVYRKSLLYLVSNALEKDQRTPILGLHKVFGEDVGSGEWDGSSSTTDVLRTWRRAVQEAGLTQRLAVVDGPQVTVASASKPPSTIPAAHGAFDNDVATIQRTLLEITGLPTLKTEVDDLRGF